MIIWVFAVLCVEAITEIMVASKLMSPIRDYLLRKSLTKIDGNEVNQRWYGYLIHCGHCTSVWMALPVSLLLPAIIDEMWVADIIVKWFALHRMSNILHSWIQPRMNREPWSVEIAQQTKDISLTMDGEDNE